MLPNDIFACAPILLNCLSPNEVSLWIRTSDQQLLDLVLERLDLALELRRFIGGDRARNNWSGDAAGATQSHLHHKRVMKQNTTSVEK